jgi:hypothetical protein
MIVGQAVFLDDGSVLIDSVLFGDVHGRDKETWDAAGHREREWHVETVSDIIVEEVIQFVGVPGRSFVIAVV